MNKNFLVYSSENKTKNQNSHPSKILVFALFYLCLISLGWLGHDLFLKYIKFNDSPFKVDLIKPLEKYSIESLSKTEVSQVGIATTKLISENNEFTSSLFSFYFDPTLANKKTKKVTGLMNLPIKNSPSPIVLLIRGYVDQSIYTSGMGSKRVGEYLAKNGYITIAPDYLGYAESDGESANIFETRFQTYTTTLTLLKSINTQNFPQWDGKNIFIWGHSNGGQIALTTLEVTGQSIPTVLWAPVVKPFPYSILYYTDESADGGKFIRKELSKFEENYNVDDFSMTNHLDRINAPIQFHLGTEDDAIPTEWVDDFVKTLKNKGKVVTYIKHLGADHNLNPTWDLTIEQTLQYFNSKLK